MHTEHVGVPIYGISYDNGILVGVGGGGSSKSGVKNWICAYRVENGRLVLLHKKETGSEAPMNVAIRGTVTRLLPPATPNRLIEGRRRRQ